MPNTIRNQNDLLALCPDNDTGEIDAQALRDIIVSQYNRILDAVPAGPQGSQGAVGAQGNQGSVGATGPQGFQGSVGSQGNQGFQGSAGAQGNQGSTGPNNITTSTATNLSGFLSGNGSTVSTSTNGSALTSLNATNISSGTLANARLTAQVPLTTNSSNTFQASSGGTTLIVKGQSSNSAVFKVQPGSGDLGLQTVANSSGNVSESVTNGYILTVGESGGNMQFGGTSRDGEGCNIQFFAGPSAASGNGGSVDMNGGTSAEGVGGGINLTAGDGDTTGGAINLYSGNCATSNGGNINIFCGGGGSPGVLSMGSGSNLITINGSSGVTSLDGITSITTTAIMPLDLRLYNQSLTLSAEGNGNAVQVYDSSGSPIGYIKLFNAE